MQLRVSNFVISRYHILQIDVMLSIACGYTGRRLSRSKTQCSIALTLIVANMVRGHPASLHSAHHTSAAMVQRQVVETSTSSFDWWPYPSWSDWGQATIPPTAIPVVTTTTPVVSPTPTGIFVIPVPDSSTLTTDEISTSTTASSTTWSASLTTPSVSLIRITALPPVQSGASLTRVRAAAAAAANHSNGFNIVYLAPFFGILGAIAGGLCTWLFYRCLPVRGSKKRRESVLISGPRYAPGSRLQQASRRNSSSDAEAASEARPSTSSGQAFLTTGEPSKGSWLERALSARSRYSTTPTPVFGADAAEDDPFLEHSTPTGHPQRGNTIRNSQRLTDRTSYGATRAPPDAILGQPARHRSIRRGILERLQLGSLRRTQNSYEPGHTSEEAADCETPRAVQHRRGHRRAETDSSAGFPDDETPSRRPTVATERSQGVTSPPGFRIFIEDPESGALLDDNEYAPDASPTPRPTKRQGSDKFTPVPVRRTAEEKRNSPFSSPSKTGFTSPTLPEEAKRPGVSRVDSSVLPMSPPRVTSPPLESQLFFGSTTSLDMQMSPPATSARHLGGPSSATMSSGPGRQHNKLHTQRSPPLLPFPSSASSSPYRGRLKKVSSARPQPPSFVADRSDGGVSSRADSTDTRGNWTACGTPAERYHARKTALSKVDEILSRSWSERQLAEGSFPGSPNNFGARLPTLNRAPQHAEDESTISMGIEQRLATYR